MRSQQHAPCEGQSSISSKFVPHIRKDFSRLIRRHLPNSHGSRGYIQVESTRRCYVAELTALKIPS